MIFWVIYNQVYTFHIFWIVLWMEDVNKQTISLYLDIQFIFLFTLTKTFRLSFIIIKPSFITFFNMKSPKLTS